MNFYESISSALSGIFNNKMRSALTMFGIIIGIASVIMITSVGEGFKVSINSQFEGMGLSNITLSIDNDAEEITSQDYLTYEDVESLRKYEDLEAVSCVSNVYLNDAVTLMDPNKHRAVYIYGVDADYFKVNTTELKEGRYIIEQDVDTSAASIIIDEDFAQQIFGRKDVLGNTLDIQSFWGNISCKIIGLVKSNRYSEMGVLYNYSAEVYLPISTVQERIWDRGSLDSINIKVKDKNKIKETADNVIRLTEVRHVNSGKYKTYSVSDEINQVNTIIGIFTMFLGFVAGISLLVGGIGVMNIMLVSVTERTREIGIRKSLGATKSNIRLQFLIEAVILTGIGGATGLALGYLGGVGIGNLASMLMDEQIIPYISLNSILLVISISTGIGLIFGVYPAARASKLDPIEALRFES